VIEKDRELLGRVAVSSPHIAGTVLRLWNELEDAHRLSELPPNDLLSELGRHIQGIGWLLTAIAGQSDSRESSPADIEAVLPSPPPRLLS